MVFLFNLLEICYRILSNTPQYVYIAQDILSHHEKFNGIRYPKGLKKDEI
jgi:HD-GYP domain-containing protein (c-di-GMP phosphodiesterase class II)